MKKVLDDSGSSVKVIFKSAHDQIKLSIEILKPGPESIYGFNNTTNVPVGSSRLLVTAGTTLLHKSLDASFLVINQPLPHNAFLRGPALIDMGAIISQKDLLMKFNTPTGIGLIREEQFLVGELYNVNLSSNKIIRNCSSLL